MNIQDNNSLSKNIHAVAFFAGIRHTTSELFKLLQEEREAEFIDFVELLKSTPISPLQLAESKGRTYSMELIAGSILQIAYTTIKTYGIPRGKSAGAVHFESEIERLRTEFPDKARIKKRFLLPEQFCVGRDIGHLPLGIVVYAARNQYNHFHDDRRLDPLNELVFNHLEMIYPHSSNKFSLDTQRGKKPLAYSVLAALGWLGSNDSDGYCEAFRRDMSEITQSVF